MSSNAFAPQPTNTAALSVTSTSTSAPIQVKGALNNATQRLLYNAGPNDCFLAWGPTSTLTAAIPVAGTPANGTPIPSGAILALSFPPNAYFAAVCATAQTATLYITPGEGN